MAYGQTAITEDLYAARDAAGGQVIDEASNVRLYELTSDRPYVTYEKEGSRRIDCDYVAGCDGQHGVSPSSIPVSLRKTYERAIRSAGSASCRRRRPSRNSVIAITIAALRLRRCALRC